MRVGWTRIRSRSVSASEALSRSARAMSRPLSRGVGLLVNHLVEDGRVTFVDDPGSGMGRAGGLHAGRPGRRHHPARAPRSARASPPSRPCRRCPRAATRPSDVGPGGPPAALRPPVSDHLLEGLQRHARTTLRAGLAWIVIGSPVNGFFPGRALVAGLRTTLSFRRLGTTN